MLQIKAYRFGGFLISSIGTESNGGREKMGGLTGDRLGFWQGASGSVVRIAAELLRDDEDNDEARNDEASTMVQVGAWIGCRWRSRVWLELADAVGFARVIPAAWLRSCCEVLRRDKKREGELIGGVAWARG
jgi:hypothetical protein